jgi:hypothetical protein
MGLGLNSGLHACKSGASKLEPHLQFKTSFFCFFWVFLIGSHCIAQADLKLVILLR